jgi:hypothetical protein
MSENDERAVIDYLKSFGFIARRYEYDTIADDAEIADPSLLYMPQLVKAEEDSN